MSLIEKKNKKTIVLFQNGLGDDGWFSQTISLNEKVFMNEVCSYEQGNYYTCKRNCCLEEFSIKNSLSKITLDALNGAVSNWITNGEFTYNFLDNSIINDIRNGIGRKEISNIENKSYYDIYASDYSHMYLRNCDETIGLILSIILK